MPVYDVTGVSLATTIQQKLTKLGFDLNQMRGQGYDGAAAMRGQFRGVQAVIKESYPKALYTHCVSHSLNLCLSDSSKIQDIRNAFGVISDVCNFFHTSAKRSEILRKNINILKPDTRTTKLKTLCETRWVVRHEAVLLFKDFLNPIVAALESIQMDLQGSESARKANYLLHCICKFHFLICLLVLCKTLSLTYNISEYLQSKNIDLVSASDRIYSVKTILEGMRTDSEIKFESVYKEAKQVADDLNTEETVPRICGIQKNRPNVTFATKEEYYRRVVYIPYLDDFISSLNERFLSQKDNVVSLQHVIPTSAVDKPFSVIAPAVNFYKDDLCGFLDVVEGEWELWQTKWSSTESKRRPATALEALMNCDKTIFPNIRQLLKILAVLPVSTSTTEISFSTLRRLKTYLRSNTSEPRLTLLSIHRDIIITDDMVMDKFVNCGKARKLHFVL